MIKRGNAYPEEGNMVASTAERGDAGGGKAAIVVVGREPIA